MADKIDVAGLLAEEIELLDIFMQQTRQQHQILTASEVDSQALNASLAERRKTLERLGQVHGSLASSGGLTAQQQGSISALLDEIQKLDGQNIKLAEDHMNQARGQAKQASQSRKGVAGYNRTDIAGGQTSALFDKKQ